MQRRTLLASLGAGASALAGCAALGAPEQSPSDTEPPSETPDGTATEIPRGDPTETPGGEWTSIVDLQTVPRTYVLPTRYRSDDGGEAELGFTRTATATHPATVSLTLRNENEFANTFRLDWLAPFGRSTSDIPHAPGEQWTNNDYTYRVGLVFAPTENHELVDDAPAVERAEDGLWRLTAGVDPWFPETLELAPGESIHGEYALVGRAEGVGKGRPTGVYEFAGRDEPIRLAVWNTDAPGPETGSRFAGDSLPELPGESTVAWYHAADETAPSFVRPSTERTDLPAEVDFTFVNHAREMARCGHWNLYKLHDGEWFHVGPWAHTADCRGVAPGDAKRWTLHAYHGAALPCQGAAVFGFLGAGRYAAVAGYGHATDRSAAMIELVGDPVRIEPTDDATAERADGRVTVTTSRWRDDERPPSATLTLRRVDDADRAIIREQVMRRRYRGLRNTLAYVETDVGREADEVVLRTDERVAEQVVGYEDDSIRFRFDGRAYEATISREKE